MSIAVVNPVRRVLGNVSTNALFSPSRHQGAQDSGSKENIITDYSTTMHYPVAAGRKRLIDEVDRCDQNSGSFTTVRLSTPETRVDDQQSKQRSTNTSSEEVMAKPDIALREDRSNVTEGSQISGGDDIVMEDATDIDIDTSAEDHDLSALAPVLKKQRTEADVARDVSDPEKEYTKKMAARVYDRISRAARLYEEREAKKKEEILAKQKTELCKVTEASKHPHHSVVPNQIATGSIGRKVSISALLPAPDLRPSGSRSSGSVAAANYTGEMSYENNDDRICSESKDRETSISANEYRRSDNHTSATHAESVPPIPERAAAITERGMAIDGLLKLMKTTTNYDRVSNTN